MGRGPKGRPDMRRSGRRAPSIPGRTRALPGPTGRCSPWAWCSAEYPTPTFRRSSVGTSCVLLVPCSRTPPPERPSRSEQQTCAASVPLAKWERGMRELRVPAASGAVSKKGGEAAHQGTACQVITNSSSPVCHCASRNGICGPRCYLLVEALSPLRLHRPFSPGQNFCLVVSAQYRESFGMSCHKGTLKP